jgi:hypothetical protein
MTRSHRINKISKKNFFLAEAFLSAQRFFLKQEKNSTKWIVANKLILGKIG